VIPIVPLIKLIGAIGYGVYKIFEKIMGGFNDYICEPAFEWLVKNMPEEDIMKAWHKTRLTS
jgi:hypothetical protein